MQNNALRDRPRRRVKFSHEDLASERILPVLGLFARLFKESVGVSPHQYVVQRRVERAKLLLSTNILIAARVLQGVGPALLVPGSLALITHGFQNPGQRARAVGIWVGSSGIGLAGSPVIGGLLVETLGWRSIFLLNVPFGLLALALTMRFVSETPLLPLHLFSSMAFRIPLLVGCVLNFGLYGLLFVLSLFFQDISH